MTLLYFLRVNNIILLHSQILRKIDAQVVLALDSVPNTKCSKQTFKTTTHRRMGTNAKPALKTHIKDLECLIDVFSVSKILILGRVVLHTIILLSYGLVLGTITWALGPYIWSLLPYNTYFYYSGGKSWSWLLWLMKYVLAVCSIVVYPFLVNGNFG